MIGGGIVPGSLTLLGGAPGIGKSTLMLQVSGPHLIIMDEPTNHMDLPSIQCLEEALADCPCALLLVSHDEHFLRKLVEIRWHLQPDTNGNDVRLEISRNIDF